MSEFKGIKICCVCDNPFTPPNKKQKTCSKSCGYKLRGNVAKHRRKSESWYKSKKGYIQGHIWIDDNTKIFVKQHRYFMENHLKRKLFASEHIHHINGIKDDNRIENLQVLTSSEHALISNDREYKKGYKMKLSDEQRKKRSEKMKQQKSKQLIKEAT